jgi:hypothetical protein
MSSFIAFLLGGLVGGLVIVFLWWIDERSR